MKEETQMAAEELSKFVQEARRRRREKKISWREMSRRTGIPVTTLFGWLEEGRRIPGSGLLLVAEVLGLGEFSAMKFRRTMPRPRGFEVSISFDGRTYRLVRIPMGNPAYVKSGGASYAP